MPLLGPGDRLPRRPQRVVVAGTSGSGKTTLARRVADALDLAHVEIDGLFHGPGWSVRAEFMDDVLRFTAGPAWVTEFQYGPARQVLAERAELVVWLDLPRRTVLRQVVVRTLGRRVRRTQLWNGNVEPPLRTVLTDREHVVRWAMSTHARTAGLVADVVGARPELPVVRLRSHRQARAWLAGPLSATA